MLDAHINTQVIHYADIVIITQICDEISIQQDLQCLW